MHHYYTGFLFDKVVGVVPYQWARFEGRVVCYGAVTAFCVTSAVCLDPFIWFDFISILLNLEQKITGFAFLLFVTVLVEQQSLL